jgi:hypothetical protein
MARLLWSWWPLMLLAGVLSPLVVRFDSGLVRAQTVAIAGWEYQTASVELGSLTPKLLELGRDGWEVFNIISIDTMVDQTPDGKTHILTQRVEVTAKKPK